MPSKAVRAWSVALASRGGKGHRFLDQGLDLIAVFEPNVSETLSLPMLPQLRGQVCLPGKLAMEFGEPCRIFGLD